MNDINFYLPLKLVFQCMAPKISSFLNNRLGPPIIHMLNTVLSVYQLLVINSNSILDCFRPRHIADLKHPSKIFLCHLGCILPLVGSADTPF